MIGGIKSGASKKAAVRRENYAALAARGVIMWSRSAPEQAVTFREHVPGRRATTASAATAYLPRAAVEMNWRPDSL